jgi:uncharacterized delta-60 repeat protein
MMYRCAKPAKKNSPAQIRRGRLAAAARMVEPLERRLLLSTANAALLADASVHNNLYANTNFGASPELYVENSSDGNDTQITFLKFNISGINTINSANLELTGKLIGSGDPSVTAGVYAVADTSWTEGSGIGLIGFPADGITSNNQPAIGSAISGATASVTSQTAQLKSFNITSYIQAQKQAGNDVISLAIESLTTITKKKTGAGIIQFDSKESGVAPSLVIDDTPPAAPTAKLTAANITSDSAAETVVAEYSGPAAIDLNTIAGGAGGNLTISGPSAASIGAVAINSSNPDDVFATYTINPANGSIWTVAENGAYTVSLKSGQVEDANDNFAATASTSFRVGVADSTPPVVSSISAAPVTSAGSGTETITVVYSDDVAVNVASIGTADISVSGPTALKVTGVTTTPTSNSNLVTATYTVAKSNGKPWAYADNGTYTIMVKAGAVTDTSGNPVAASSGSFTATLPPPDTTPPTDSITAPASITTPGNGTESITVVYTDNVAVSAGTIGVGDLTFSGHTSPQVTAVTINPSTNAAAVTATYTVAKSNNQPWAYADNGTYIFTIAADAVTDTSGNGVPAKIGSFVVSLPPPDTTPPTDVITAPNINTPGATTQTITVQYIDNVAVDISTIGNSNISVTGPAGTLSLANLTKLSNSDGPVVTAVYTFQAPSSGWSYLDDGTYEVALAAHSVTDTSGNAAPADSASFVVNIPAPADPNDSTFNAGSPVTAPFTAEATAALTDGQVVVVGEQVDAATGNSQGVIEMFNADGSIDASFGNNGFVDTPASADDAFHAVLAQGTNFIVAGSGDGFLLQRYKSSGQLDTSFGTNGSSVTTFGGTNEAAYCLTFSPSGGIVAAGTSSGNLAFADYDANGNLVTSFGQSGLQLFDVGSSADVVGNVAFQSDGDLVAVGSSAAQIVLVRLNTSGNADDTFGTDGLVIVPDLVANTSQTTGDHSEGLAIESDNSILVANQTAGGHFGLVHLDANGNLISSFGTSGLATASFGTEDDADAVFVQSGGQIVVTGTTNASGGTAIAAFDQNGVRIANFGLLGQLTFPGGVGAANGGAPSAAFAAVTPDGHLIVGTDDSASSSVVRKLAVAGTANENAGTLLGSFAPGAKNKLTVGINGVTVTLTITGGTGQAFLATNGLHLEIAAGSHGATLTIICKGGSRSVTLGDVTVTGTLKSLVNKSANLAGTLSATGAIGTLSLGNVTGGTIAAAGGISSLSVLSAADAYFLAGANLGADGEQGGSGTDADTFSGGAIRTFKVAGSLTNSVIAAGVEPDDGIYLGGNDTLLGGTASIIRSISVHSIDLSTRFIAGAFGTANIPRKVKPGLDSHFEIL